MKKILLVEDDPSYVKLLNSQLTKKGYEVSEAKDGEEGLTAVKLQKPDLILLDVKMPVMDGLTMLAKLRKDPFGKSAQVIILTNLEPNDQMLKDVLAGQPTYYLIKSDIHLSELMEKIESILLI